MDPVRIGDSFGWFGAGRSHRGVVLCGTFGFEQHVAHRWWRDLAEGVAGEGCAVLRFDYPGEGDSAGLVASLDTALDTIRQAVRFLREEAGAQEIVLVGLRLGGTLAALVAEEGGIDGLVLLAPFARGRAYLREMEMQAALVDIVPDGAPLPKPSGVLSVGGFVLSPGLVHDLARIELRQAERPPAPRILLLGPDPAGLAARYAALGSQVERGMLPGLSALVSDAALPRMEEEARARLLAFVRDGATLCDVPPVRRPWEAAAMAGPGWEEEPTRFGDGLFGIRCRPPGAAAATPAVLFITMGTDVHSGYGRQATALARALAQGGVPSLRFDLRGVGDSDDRPDGILPLYRPDAVADVGAALDDLTEEGDRPIVAVGTCHGAYLAFHAACQDRRIAAALLVNLYCFDWDLTHGGVAYGATPVRHRAAYAAMLLKGATWRRILGGTTPVVTIARMLLRRGAARLFAAVRPESRTARALPIATRIAALRRRGGRLVLLYSAGDLGLVDLRTQLGSRDHAAAILGEPVTVVPGADHSFSAEPAQDLLLRELRRLAGACGSHTRVPTVANGALETRMASPRLQAT